MTLVVLNETDRLEWAIKHFRRQVQRSGVLRDVKKKRYYVKPSTAKRIKAAAAQRRRHRSGRRRSS
jgi:small subunit ribosomal protein S21